MKAIKILASGIVIVCALTFYIMLGSIDSGTVPAVQPPHPFDDAGNGFLKIAYLNSAESLLSDEQREAVKKQLDAGIWSDSLTALIAEHSKCMDDYLSIADYPILQTAADPNPEVMPNYINILDLGRLVLLKSRQSAERGELDQAISLAGKALTISARVKTDKSEFLISFFIGVAMQNDALRWLNKLSQSYPLSAASQRQLIKTLNSLPSFHADGFKEVFAGEYRFAVAQTDQVLDAPLVERWQTYLRGEDYWNHDLDGDWDFGRENMKEEIYGLLSALFPRFHTHRNEILSMVANDYAAFAEQAKLYCNQVPLIVSDEAAGVTWSILIRPNGGAQLWRQHGRQLFYQYFIRRCLAQTHIEVTRTLVALRLYQMEHGHFPASLDALLPQYLHELPIDPFDGRPMRYSSEDRWVYSLGADFQDDGGSAEACLEPICFQGERCADNPTFPLFEHLCATPPVEQVDQ